MKLGDQRLPVRFWDKVKETPCDVEGIGDCWSWTAAISKGYFDANNRERFTGGYPQFSVSLKKGKNGVMCYAHRIILAIDQGAKGLVEAFYWFKERQVHHRCKNRSCVNPVHLIDSDRSEHRAYHNSVRHKPDDFCTGLDSCHCSRCTEEGPVPF